MEATLTKKDGKIQMDKSFEFMCSTLRNGEYTVTIKKKTQPRTLNQNALMWKWFQCIGACLREYTGIGALLLEFRIYMTCIVRSFL